eukprot:TRINITY_DN14440_c0_g1_i1.p1 TRINITY_DN14440_c0_g1~~TRINITY_DN14440_c0_g1_i1.p1  ORF type:complete len:206 (-),score=26.95 TRINITY_DN14440_c0_g1_i1:607-1224(-)
MQQNSLRLFCSGPTSGRPLVNQLMPVLTDFHCTRFQTSIFYLRSSGQRVSRKRFSIQSSSDFRNLDQSFIGAARRADASGSKSTLELNLVDDKKSQTKPTKSVKSKKGDIKGSVKFVPVSADVPHGEQRLVVQATSRGRAGKTVTVISGLQLTEVSLQSLAKQLKALLGTGGAVKDGNVEIQGNHAAKLTEELTKMGFKAVKSGK